ncbi:hypothetical protein GOP47_0016286 [Adiantum capillus-veneris]|uniref:Uncharacterized protein n=1 Tax=Adiantum capillus-veneris TaxID=13818 RepID=A0A9D4UHD0_ADICA|nr:hypothetical protein GOP47_0016286 [Adiantum capillus-veneris]
MLEAPKFPSKGNHQNLQELFVGRGPLQKGDCKSQMGHLHSTKNLGVLGVRNVSAWADKLAIKTVIRALEQPEVEWAYLLFWRAFTSKVKDFGASSLESQYSLVTPIGSALLKSVCQAWERGRPMLGFSQEHI